MDHRRVDPQAASSNPNHDEPSRCRPIIIFHYSSKTVHQRSSRGLPSRIVHDTAIASTRGVNYVPSYRVTLALEIPRGSRTKTGRIVNSRSLSSSFLPFLPILSFPPAVFLSQDRKPSIARRKYKIEFQRLFRLAAGARSTDPRTVAGR